VKNKKEERSVNKLRKERLEKRGLEKKNADIPLVKKNLNINIQVYKQV